MHCKRKQLVIANKQKKAGAKTGSQNRVMIMMKYSNTLDQAQAALSFISPLERETWVKMAMALKSEFGDSARDVWEIWSQQADSYNLSDAAAVWRGIRQGGVGLGSLFYEAKQNGWECQSGRKPLRNEVVQFRAETKQKALQAQQVRYSKNAAKNKQLWRNSLPIDGNTPVNRYLASRGLINPPSHALRWAKLPYHHEGEVLGYYPVMLAAVTNPSGELVTLHRTYLTAGGAKAEVPTVKKLMPCAAPMSGASIKLYAPQRRTDGGLALGVAEGIETALAAQRLFGVPVWPCVSANGLVSFTPPCEVTHLYVFADNDVSNTGQRAAKELAERTALLGHEVRIHTPPKVGDWADVLVEGVSHE